MRLLVDTHVWLWLQVKPERIGSEVRSALADARNEILLSAASAWEIAIKYALCNLPLPEPPATYVTSRMARSGTNGLPIETRHAAWVASLPHHHRDPFDRLLVAQAQLEKLVLVTADAQFAAYDVDRIAV